MSFVRSGDILTIAVGAGEGQGKVLLLGYDRQHRTQVGCGENGGRTLLEVNIVRSVRNTGTWKGVALRLEAVTPACEDMAVIVQSDDGRILGVGRLSAAS